MALHDAVTLQASAAKTETGTGSTVTATSLTERLVNRPYKGIAFILDVTAAATDAGDTLDVQVQTQIDGTNWVPVVSFTQVLGNGGTVRHVAKVVRDVAQSMFEDSASLAAGSVRNLLGNTWRVKWTIADAGTDNASFTFSVVAVPQ